MEKKLEIQLSAIKRLCGRQAFSLLKRLLYKLYPVDIAHFMRYLGPQEQSTIFTLIDDMDFLAKIVSELDPTLTENLLRDEKPEKILAILEYMSKDDATDLLGLIPEETADEVLHLMTRKESEKMENLLMYPEDTAGGIMTTEYFALHQDMSIEEAIKAIRETPNVENLLYVYVKNDSHQLTGVLALRQLIINPTRTLLKDIMIRDVISVRADVDQEEVAGLVAKYNLLAIPVVDECNVLLGIVTVDDVIDVIRQENTEDIYRMAGTMGEELLEKSSLKIAGMRLPWLAISLVGESISGFIMHYYKGTLREFIALSFFIPLIMALGGNVGNQSQTIVVRGLATGRIDENHMAPVVLKQLFVGLLMALIASVILSLGTMVFARDAVFTFVVGISFCLSIVISCFMGTVSPIILKKLHMDPALAAGPFITNFNDVVAILIYLGCATFLLVR